MLIISKYIIIPVFLKYVKGNDAKALLVHL